MNIDFGLSVTYDGKVYTLMCPDHLQEYPVGGLICEYCRLEPTEIKKVIQECSGLDEIVTPDNMVTVMMEFHEKLFEYFPPVTATMISLEFQNTTLDWMTAIREDRIGEYVNNFYQFEEKNKIAKYILEGSPYMAFGCETMRQVMLSSYFTFAESFVHMKYMFLHIVGDIEESEQRKKVLDVYSDLYGDLMDMQHIDFRFMATIEKGLESLYTIKSSLSLLLFEMAHAQHNDQHFIKCANCGCVFVPTGRCDAIYCSYPSPQNKEKSCKAIGAQVARANKEKNDIITGTYRRAYMRHKMMIQRHPYDKEKRKKFESLTAGMKTWRIKLADGSGTTAQFLEWIEQF